MVTAIDPALFRETLGHYPTGVAVVTGIAQDGRPAGMVVGSFTSISLDPPLVAFSPTLNSASFAHLRSSNAFCVNVLASDQEALCRQFATAGPAKFDNVSWQPGPLGSPILDGAVSWVECTFDTITEAGDHYVVLGQVRHLAVQRSTLPLLFFQGGYGRFTPRSLVAAPDPELIQAAQLAETMRADVERLGEQTGLNCGVLAKIEWDAVQVLAASGNTEADPLPLGHRQPLIPPFGAVFLIDADEAQVEAWLSRSTNANPDSRETNRRILGEVRRSGAFVLCAEPSVLERQEAVVSEFERSDRLPRHASAVAQATTELGAYYCPELVPGEHYNVTSIVVPIPSASPFGSGPPPMAVRFTGFPSAAPGEHITEWLRLAQQVAGAAPMGRSR